MSTVATIAVPLFPGRAIAVGESDSALVKKIQQRINGLGCGPIDEDGEFGPKTKNAVMLFQARFPDSDGLPLTIDGIVGPITWAALFGPQSVPPATSTSVPLLAATLAVATREVGVLEVPPGSNRGSRVDEYVRSVGLNPADANPWCAAFVYFCFDEAARTLGQPNPVIRTGSVLDHWNRAGAKGIPRVLQNDAVAQPGLVKPGHIFMLATGEGHGHTGLVEQSVNGKLVSIEGNTSVGGSREGIGVFRRTSRKIVDINLGFIDYA
jgi:hypothetical protein